MNIVYTQLQQCQIFKNRKFDSSKPKVENIIDEKKKNNSAVQVIFFFNFLSGEALEIFAKFCASCYDAEADCYPYISRNFIRIHLEVAENGKDQT